MRVLVWHWGRRGAGPRFAADLAAGLNRLPGTTGLLSLPVGAEILTVPDPPRNDLGVPTYASAATLLARLATAPALLRRLDHALAELRPDRAICAMPALLDLLMLHALRRRGIPAAIVAHDAVPHPGEPLPWRLVLQRATLRRAAHPLALSPRVAHRLTAETGRAVPVLAHPPFGFGPMPPPRAHGGRLRLLVLGRLLPYKGLDLLAATLRRLDLALVETRIAGSGPDSAALAALRALPGVSVDKSWVPEEALPALLAWADLVLLTHTEASQSGVAAAAWGAGRFIVAAGTGGLRAQLAGIPGAVVVPPDAARLAGAVMALAATHPHPVPDADAAWSGFAADLLGLWPAQRQPRPIASVSCCWVRSGPTWVPSPPTPPPEEDVPARPGPAPPRPALAPPPRDAPPLRP